MSSGILFSIFKAYTCSVCFPVISIIISLWIDGYRDLSSLKMETRSRGLL